MTAEKKTLKFDVGYTNLLIEQVVDDDEKSLKDEQLANGEKKYSLS